MLAALGYIWHRLPQFWLMVLFVGVLGFAPMSHALAQNHNLLNYQSPDPTDATSNLVDEQIDIASDLIADPTTSTDADPNTLAPLTDEQTDDLSEELWQQTELLNFLSQNPLNLNTVCADSLALLPYMTMGKAQAIVRHRRKVGTFHSLPMLLTVRGITYADIFNLQPYVTLSGQAAPRPSRHYLKAEMVNRIESQWPRSVGFEPKTDSTAAPYLGPPYKSLWRCRIDLGDHFRLGFTAETDAGEPRVWQTDGHLADFASGFVAWTMPRGVIRRAVLGSYNLRLGQGLGLWSGFGFSPLAGSASPMRVATGIMASSSSAESNRLHGAAAELALDFLHPIRLTLFFSRVREDATVKRTDKGDYYITGLRSGGLHRTTSERESRHNVPVTIGGAYASQDFDFLRVGLGANIWHSDTPLGVDPNTASELYRANGPRGRNVVTLHSDLKAFVGPMVLWAEVVSQGLSSGLREIESKGVRRFTQSLGATIGTEIAMGTAGCISLALRRFGPSYRALVQQPVAQTSAASGEGGGYVGFEIQPLKKMVLMASFDLFRIHWLGYNVWSPTTGWKVRVQSLLNLSKRTQLNIKFRHQRQETTLSWDYAVADNNDAQDNEALQSIELRGVVSQKSTTDLKTLLTLTPSANLTLHTMAEGTRAEMADRTESYGILLCQDAKVNLLDGLMQLSASLSAYSTGNYAARVFSRMPNVLYDMSFGTCYGRGLNLVTMLRLAPSRNWRLWLWASHTQRSDVGIIGSGNDLTPASHRTKVKAQVQFKLRQSPKRDYFAPVQISPAVVQSIAEGQ